MIAETFGMSNSLFSWLPWGMKSNSTLTALDLSGLTYKDDDWCKKKQ